MRVNYIFICLFFLMGCSIITPPKERKIKDCLSVQFYDKNSEKDIVLRETSGDKQIIAVKTPIGRRSSIIKQFKFSVQSFGKKVSTPEETKKQYGIFSYCFPQKSTWDKIKHSFKAKDNIFLFSGTDSGFVVIRSNHLYCMVVTNHGY